MMRPLFLPKLSDLAVGPTDESSRRKPMVQPGTDGVPITMTFHRRVERDEVDRDLATIHHTIRIFRSSDMIGYATIAEFRADYSIELDSMDCFMWFDNQSDEFSRFYGMLRSWFVEDVFDYGHPLLLRELHILPGRCPPFAWIPALDRAIASLVRGDNALGLFGIPFPLAYNGRTPRREDANAARYDQAVEIERAALIRLYTRRMGFVLIPHDYEPWLWRSQREGFETHELDEMLKRTTQRKEIPLDALG